MLGLGLKRMFGINRGGLSLPFAQNLLGAWLHKKAPQETTILDERSGIDKTREPIRGQGLKFTGVEYVTHPYQLTNGTDSFSFECEVIFSNLGSGDYLFDGRGASNSDSIALYLSSGLRLQAYYFNSVAIQSDALENNVRYLISLSFSNSNLTLSVAGDNGYSFTQTVAGSIPPTAFTLFVGTRYTQASFLEGTLGWYRISKNGITTIECALEDGPTVILFNRIQPSFQGTIQGATLSTFRVEDDRITNGGNGSYWNQEGGTVSGSVRIPRAVTLNTSLGSNLIPLNFVGISLDSNASVVDGKLVLNNSSGISRYSGIVSSGKTYKIIITVDSVVSGTVKVWVGGNNTPIITTAGTYEYLISKGSINDWVGVNPTQFTGVVSYLSCQEVLGVDSTEPLNTDVLGQPLTYTKPAAINLQMVNSNCGYLFEALSRFNHSSITVNDFTIIFYANLDLVLNQETQFRSLYGGGSSDIFYLQSDGLYFRAAGTINTTSSFWSGGDFTAEDFTGWKIFVATRNFQTGVISLTVNGKTKTATETNSLGFGFTSSGFATSNGQSFDGELMYSCMYNRILTEEEINNWNPFLPPQEGLELFHLLTAGAGTLIPDISGNGRHGILAGTTLSTFWSKKQDVFHWNIRKGFTEVYWLDGVDDYIELNTQISLTGDFFIDFEFFNTTAITYVFSSGGEYLRISSGILQFRIDSNINNITSGVLLGFHTGRLQRVSGVITCIFDGVEYPVVSSATTVDVISLGTHVNSFISSIIQSININNEYTGSGITWPDATISGSPAKIKLPLTLGNGQYTNPAGKWHNGAETEFNAPSCPELVIANKQFDTGFWYTIPNKLIGSPTLSGGINVVGTTGTVDGVDDAIIITLNDVNNLHLAENGNVFENGKTYRVTFDYYIPSTNTQVNAILGPADANTIGNSYFSVLDAWTSVSVIITTKGDNNINGRKLRFYAAVGSSTSPILAENDWFALKNVTIYEEHNVNDIAYADIVDNYEDADTLFADVAEDNKRMKLLQYKNPLTE